MDFLFFVNNTLLGAGLAMDAFSVSLANGLHEPLIKRTKMCAIAGVYAFFQFLMPLTGWICVHTICNLFTQFQSFIPWIALLLLLYIGGKMLHESLSHKDSGENTSSTLTVQMLLLQGIATSIDALSVGFMIACYTLPAALTASVLIAVVTFVICYAGLIIGKKSGTKLSGKAEIFGGIILILIGIEIFVKGVFL